MRFLLLLMGFMLINGWVATSLINTTGKPVDVAPLKMKKVTFTIAYNNIPYRKDLKTSWGMSCYIEGLEKNILFDTGGDGEILLYNMKKLGIDPKRIDVIVLSHIHADHIQGVWEILKIKPGILVYIPSSFPQDLKDRLKSSGAKVIEIKEPLKICKGVWSTGEMGEFIKEQSLIIDTPKGIIVLTGCAHPGIVSIVDKAERMLRRDRAYLALGGFHLMAYSNEEIKRIINGLKKLNVEKVGPSHCTGGEAIELFRRAWGDNFIDMGCGREITIQ